MRDSSNKRHNTAVQGGNSNKKSKTNNYWRKNNYQTLTGIEPGWQGLFATCDRGKESRAVAEMYPILEECVLKLYPELEEDAGKDEDEEDEDIESAIQKEISNVKNQVKKGQLVASVKIDAQCVTFFRLKPPLVPTEVVKALCESAQQPGAGTIRSQYLHRLTPVSRTGKATLEGLREVAKEVLEPHFHQGQQGLKFAIRPTTRNHSVLKRDEIIKTIASCVGPAHTVNLKEYDLLIIVELYKNICGISVVKDFEKLKRFNFGQLQIDASQVRVARDEFKEGVDQEQKKEEVSIEKIEKMGET